MSGSLLTKRWDLLPPDFAKSRIREIGCETNRITPKLDKLICRAAETLVKFQSDRKI